MTIKYILILSSLLLASCSTVSNIKVSLGDIDEVELGGKKYKYVITHSRTKWFYEGVHAIPLIPKPHDDADWIYLNIQSGKACVPDIAFTNYKELFYSPREAKGCVTIEDNKIAIDIYFPQVKDGFRLEHAWSSYRFNGVYEIENLDNVNQ
jgi:hypothetical protein